MTLKANCVPRPSVFAADRRAIVLSLDTFLKGQVHGQEFFDENYFTRVRQLVPIFPRVSPDRSGRGRMSIADSVSRLLPERCQAAHSRPPIERPPALPGRQ